MSCALGAWHMAVQRSSSDLPLGFHRAVQPCSRAAISRYFGQRHDGTPERDELEVWLDLCCGVRTPATPPERGLRSEPVRLLTDPPRTKRAHMRSPICQSPSSHTRTVLPLSSCGELALLADPS